MLIAICCIAAGAVLATLYLVLSARRHTPFLHLDLDKLPSVGQCMATLAAHTGGSVHRGNAVNVIQNGAIFDAMAADIEAAEHTVHLETFVWTTGKVERRFVELLARKARDGVCVRLLVDAVGGSGGDPDNLQRLRDAGAEVCTYGLPHWGKLQRFNHRTHRKLLILDGQIGYTFGHGFGDLWTGDGTDEKHWRDTGVRVQGPAVLAMQSVFMENWVEETHHVPAGDGCFPEPPSGGDCDVHVVSSASGDVISRVGLLYTLAIACARREVIIQNPYFAPDDGVVKLLAVMVKRGVEVHLMVPGEHTDSPFVRRAGCRLYAKMLEAGVRLYEFQPTLIHQKIVIVDGEWSHVGSTNFDARSLALNEEVGIGVRDVTVATKLRDAFRDDLRHSREVTLAEWKRRPWYAGAIDWAVYQIHDQL